MTAVPRLITLAKAAAMVGDDVTPASLRTEARKGRLHIVRVAGKDYCTADELAEMIDRCRVQPRGQGSTLESDADAILCGSSSTEQRKLAQDAAKGTVQALKERLAASRLGFCHTCGAGERPTCAGAGPMSATITARRRSQSRRAGQQRSAEPASATT